MESILDEEFEISEYETGKQAMDGLLNNVPDLILLDISLPEISSPEVLQWIRSQESDMPTGEFLERFRPLQNSHGSHSRGFGKNVEKANQNDT